MMFAIKTLPPKSTDSEFAKTIRSFLTYIGSKAEARKEDSRWVNDFIISALFGFNPRQPSFGYVNYYPEALSTYNVWLAENSVNSSDT